MGKPWFAWYPGDYSRDTAHLSMMEDGAYRRLLDHYYSTGRPLPSDNEQLFRICRAFTAAEQQAVGNVLQQFFQLENGDVFTNGRVERELVKQAQYREKLSRGAQKTNQKRWGSPSESASDRVPQPQPQKYPPPLQDFVCDLELQRKSEFSQSDFDARDLRRLSDARKELQLKLEHGWGSNLTDDEIFEHQCAIAGLYPERACEILDRKKKPRSLEASA